MKNDPESVAWRERMRSGLHDDPKTEAITPLPNSDAEAGTPKTLPWSNAKTFPWSIDESQAAAKYLESIDKSLRTIKHVVVFFFWLTIIGVIMGMIAAISR
jgi:hypothetical protein